MVASSRCLVGRKGETPAPPLSRHPLRTCPRAMSLEEILLPVRPTTLGGRSKLPAKPRINSECIQCNSEYFLSGAFTPSLSPSAFSISDIPPSLGPFLPLGMMHLRRYDLYVRQPALPYCCLRPFEGKSKKKAKKGKRRRPSEREGGAAATSSPGPRGREGGLDG